MIDVGELTVRYGNVPVIDNLSLHVPAGQFLLVTGPSGCGKSTLARVLAGLIPHAIPAELSGAVSVDGLNTGEHNIAELARHVGIVLQNPASQLFHLTMAEEVAFGPRSLGLPADEVERRVTWALQGLPASRSAGRLPFPVASNSEWPWLQCWRCGQRCWYSTSPRRRWTRRARAQFSTRCGPSITTWG